VYQTFQNVTIKERWSCFLARYGRQKLSRHVLHGMDEEIGWFVFLNQAIYPFAAGIQVGNWIQRRGLQAFRRDGRD
jgi:hypothetical protein